MKTTLSTFRVTGFVYGFLRVYGEFVSASAGVSVKVFYCVYRRFGYGGRLETARGGVVEIYHTKIVFHYRVINSCLTYKKEKIK